MKIKRKFKEHSTRHGQDQIISLVEAKKIWDQTDTFDSNGNVLGRSAAGMAMAEIKKVGRPVHTFFSEFIAVDFS